MNLSPRNYRSDDIRDVRDRRAGSSSQIKHLAAGLHEDVADTALQSRREAIPYQNGSAQLRTERVPLSVFDLLSRRALLVRNTPHRYRKVDRDLLLSVDSAARGKVASTQNIFLG